MCSIQRGIISEREVYIIMDVQTRADGMQDKYDIGLAFFVYKRPEHTRRVVQSILENRFDNIYVFQDGLRSEHDEAEWKEVQQVIHLLQDRDGSSVEIHISDVNKGLANSITQGISYVLEKHRAVIALEDDILLGKDYHRFASLCFERYENVPQVKSICAAGASDAVDSDVSYNRRYPYDVYFTYRLSSMAFGTWRDRWKDYDRDPKIAQRIWEDETQKTRLGRLAGRDNLNYLEMIVNHPENINTWAFYWTALQVFSGGVTVTPLHALAEDIGRDGTGTNTRAATDQFVHTIHELSFEVRFPENQDITVDPYFLARQNIVCENGNYILRNIKLLRAKYKQILAGYRS